MEFIYECDDIFPIDFCNHIIEKFEKSGHTKPGVAKGKHQNVKKSLDLPTYRNPDMTNELESFNEMIKIGMGKYTSYIQEMQVDDGIKDIISEYINDSFIYPPQIQKTVPGGYFHWHHDEQPAPNPRRITYIIYLNDVDEDSGGTTEFTCGKIIQPKAGKIIFFPSTWTYFHRGKTLTKGVKYIATASLDKVPPHISTPSPQDAVPQMSTQLVGGDISEMINSFMIQMNKSHGFETP